MRATSNVDAIPEHEAGRVPTAFLLIAIMAFVDILAAAISLSAF